MRSISRPLDFVCRLPHGDHTRAPADALLKDPSLVGLPEILAVSSCEPNGLNSCQCHFEGHLRYLILLLYEEYGITTGETSS